MSSPLCRRRRRGQFLQALRASIWIAGAVSLVVISWLAVATLTNYVQAPNAIRALQLEVGSTRTGLRSGRMDLTLRLVNASRPMW